MKRKLEIDECFSEENLLETSISLPVDLIKETSNYLTVKDIHRWSMTQQGYYSLFRTTGFLLSRFQTCVARGEQDEARLFLKMDLTLMNQTGWVKDYSNRIFYTSAFKYLLGALDTRYMFNMFITCLREDGRKSLQTKIEIAKELLKQYEDFEKEGITYTLDDVSYTEQHFGFTPLLEALEAFVKNFPQGSSRAEKNKFFNCEVGKAQILVPAHLAQHYCDPDIAFVPVRTFTAETFKRSLEITEDVGTWWKPKTGVLGKDCAYVGRAGGRVPPNGRERCDLNAVTALFKTRKNDKLAIKQVLEKLIQELELELSEQLVAARAG